MDTKYFDLHITLKDGKTGCMRMLSLGELMKLLNTLHSLHFMDLLPIKSLTID